MKGFFNNFIFRKFINYIIYDMENIEKIYYIIYCNSYKKLKKGFPKINIIFFKLK